MADGQVLSQLSEVISSATAPSFMLGAVAGFLSIIVSRAERITAAWHLATTGQRGPDEVFPVPVEVLERRMGILHGAIYFAVLSALATAALLVLAFFLALIRVRHEPGAIILFMLALFLLMASLVQLTRDVRIAMGTLPGKKLLP